MVRSERKGSRYSLSSPFFVISAGLTAYAHFESGLMLADRLLTGPGSLVERGKPVSRSALGAALGPLDLEITQTLFWGSSLPGSKIGLWLDEWHIAPQPRRPQQTSPQSCPRRRPGQSGSGDNPNPILGFQARTRVQDRAVAGRSTGRILHNLVEWGKPVPRPALGVVLGGRDWGMG